MDVLVQLRIACNGRKKQTSANPNLDGLSCNLVNLQYCNAVQYLSA
jgi:hypothetical protein